MDCYCDEGPTPKFYHLTMRKARKVHKCYECRSEIKPNELYEDVRGCWEDRPLTIKTCSDCIEIREALEEMPCFCWMHGSLLNAVETQLTEADFTPGLRYAYLRLLASHRYRLRRRKKCTTH